MIASSPVRMQDQNPAVILHAASAVQIHHQYVTELPAPAAPAVAVSWSPVGGGVPGTTLIDYELDAAAGLPTTAAFQQLLDSFGCQSEDDDDDDAVVVNLDDSMTARHLSSLRHHQAIVPAPHAVRSAATC